MVTMNWRNANGTSKCSKTTVRPKSVVASTTADQRMCAARSIAETFTNTNMSRPKFTLEEGLLVQYSQLAKWKQKLNAKCYTALANECHERNRLLAANDSGHKVFRGQDLTTFVENFNPLAK